VFVVLAISLALAQVPAVFAGFSTMGPANPVAAPNKFVMSQQLHPESQPNVITKSFTKFHISGHLGIAVALR
jgi:hypothetical protein